MNIFKKIIGIVLSMLTLSILYLQVYNKNINVYNSIDPPIKISILTGNYNIYITASLSENFKKIQQENPGTVEYTFFDGKGNQIIQNTQLASVLNDKNTDLILLDMADIKYTKYAVERIKEQNIPVIFFGNAEPEAVLSYKRAYLVAPNPEIGGLLQGKILLDVWNKNKGSMDKNGDNILQYIILEGTPTNVYAVSRTKYSIIPLNENNIKIQELDKKICNWDENEAKEAVKTVLLRFGTKIEAIISNDDTMAIGAIKILQQYGYNISNDTKNIAVIGFDGKQEAQDLIMSGFMTGTIIQDPYSSAKDLYTISLNLKNNKNLIANTNCTIDSTGQMITAPYKGILTNFK